MIDFHTHILPGIADEVYRSVSGEKVLAEELISRL